MAVEKLVSEEYGPDRYSSLKGVNIYIESEQAVARLGYERRALTKDVL
jgi:hypothetical protein